MTETIGNRQLAARARDLADQTEPGTLARKAAGAAPVALATTKSLGQARDILTAWDGPGDVRGAAVRLLGQLAYSRGQFQLPVPCHVAGRSGHDLRVVTEVANAPVAVVAQEPAYLAGHVIVVDVPAAPA